MISLKMDFTMRNLSIPVNIWNKNKNRFEETDALFDTGAHTSAIDTTVLLNLGYDLGGAEKSYIATASSSLETAHRVRIDKIILDETPLADVLFNTFAFPIMSSSVIIGMNIIRQFEVTMNFKSKLITMRENYLTEDDDYYYDAKIFGDWRAENI